ncbi:MAG: hypothetical protein IJA55_01120 [Clostridia bacterium]|nr:hypothetical protein [Clostridia bacterium]
MKKTVALLTLIIMLITSVPMSLYVSAGEMLNSDNESSEEYIYYSELFYSYPHYLKNNTYIDRYQADTSGLVSNVLAEYVTTDHFGLSVASQVLGQATDMTSVVKYLSNNMNYQNFVFENEIDLANSLFIKTLSENDTKKSVTDFSKNSSELVKNFSLLTKLVDSNDAYADLLREQGILDSDYDMYKGILQNTFDYLGTVATNLSDSLPEVSNAMGAQLEIVFESVSGFADAFEFAAALATTVMAQDAQIELIDDIIATAPRDSLLYAGMTRLRSQLKAGAVAYFSETYLADAHYKKIIESMGEGFMSAVGGKLGLPQITSLITVAVDIFNAVVLKGVLGADYETYISAVLMADYTRTLATCVDNKADSFAQISTSDKIMEFDNLFNAYIAMNKETYGFFCKLAEHNSTYGTAYAEGFKSIYDDISYERYIEEARSYVAAIPAELREVADHGDWTVSGVVVARGESDIIETGVYYLPAVFNGSIKVSSYGTLTLTEGHNVMVNGSVTLGDRATLNVYGELDISGALIGTPPRSTINNYGRINCDSIEITGHRSSSFEGKTSKVVNCGELNVNKDIRFNNYSWFNMNEAGTTLTFGGNFIVGDTGTNMDITAGTITLNGTEVQQLTRFTAYDIIIDNPAGVKYMTDITVRGRYDPKGNPIDNSGFTCNISGNGYPVSGSDYGRLNITKAITLEGEYGADINLSGGVLTVEENTHLYIRGNLNLNYSTINNNGDFTVTGNLYAGEASNNVYNYGRLKCTDLTVNADKAPNKTYFYNYGILEVLGNLDIAPYTNTSYFYMSGEDSVLMLAGNFNNCHQCSITDGTVILNGTRQQELKNFGCHNLIVTNPEGIKYLNNVTVTGEYDLGGNPLDNNGFKTYISDTGSIVDGNDYKEYYFSGDHTLSGTYTGNMSADSITVEDGKTLIINGNLTFGGTLTNYGTVIICGDVIMGSRVDNYGEMSCDSLSVRVNTYNYYYTDLYNHGKLTVSGDIDMFYTNSNGSGRTYGHLYMDSEDAVISLGGDIEFYSAEYSGVSAGEIILNGTEQQSLNGLACHDLTVTNPEGIKGSAIITGTFDLCGNPLDGNTVLKEGGKLCPGNDYKNVSIEGPVVLEGGEYIGNFVIRAAVTVPEGANVIINGNVDLRDAPLTNYGDLRIDGYFNTSGYHTYVYNYGSVTVDDFVLGSSGYYDCVIDCYNYGRTTVKGDFTVKSHVSGAGARGTLYMQNDDAVLTVGGNVDMYTADRCKLSEGTVIFNGTGSQILKLYGTLDTVIIENESYEGVKFATGLNYKTLFDHKGNRFSGGVSNVDYDGDGMYDRYDPKPTVNEKASIITRDYDVMIGHADEISHIRYASGIHETSSSIKNAVDRVDIDASVIAENTENNVYTRNMPDGGVYTFWIKLNDGTTYLRTVDMSRMKQRVSVDGVRITTHNLYGVKDYFIAEGDYDTYAEIKQNGYIFSAAKAKLAGKHDYTYTVSNPGRHTVLVRYDDTTRSDEVFKVDLVVDEPTFTVNGLQVTIGNIPGVKVIRTAYGEYDTPGNTKRAEGARNFSNKAVIKDADSYTIQYREEGMITIVVEYENGYVKVFHHNLVQKKPTFEQNGNIVTFGSLDGLVMIRYAMGEYSNSSEIKKAEGSKAIKPDAVVDGTISVTDLAAGTYTFCVQYIDESYNYYTITVQ